jgi:hypothetical protein
MSAIFRSSRYANTISTLALFFALVGTATAASVTLLTGAQVKNGSLTGADLANHSIGFGKLNRAAVMRLKGRAGARGMTGLAGPAGLVGARGLDGATGATGAVGPAGSGIVLAGYAKTVEQTLPDDSGFHAVWSMNVTAQARQLFILTGAIGGASTPSCGAGNFDFTEQVVIDAAPSSLGAFLTLEPGTHTVSYEIRGNCPGFPVLVPAQEVILIPFTLP